MSCCINIKSNIGKSTSVSVNSEETVGELKRKLYGEKWSQHRLIFAGRNLEDDQTLGHYKIKDGSTLYDVRRGRKGLSQPGDEIRGKTSGTLGNKASGTLGINTSGTLAMLELLEMVSLFNQISAEKEKRDPVPQSTEPEPRPTTERSSSGEADTDLQFLHCLLPALKRMDLRRRELAKAAIQQLMYKIEFNDNLTSDIGSMAAEAVRRLQTSDRGQDGGRVSPAFSYLSMKSEASLPPPPNFSTGPPPDCRSSPASSVNSKVSDEQIPH